MSSLRPRRSALYMPAANERALEKAKGISTDAIIFDLEDAVSPDSKDIARYEYALSGGASGGSSGNQFAVDRPIIYFGSLSSLYTY